jgi:hypothetical protein
MQKFAVIPGFPLVTLLFASTLAHAQTTIIPQVVDGGAWLTTIVLTNTSANSATADLTFSQEISGASTGATQPWPLNFVEINSAQAQAVVLTPGSTRFLHTLGNAPVTTIGWGQLSEADGAGAIVAYAIFAQRSGTTVQQGTAPASAAVSRILVPFNNTSGIVTSMAIANPTSSNESISVAIRTPFAIEQTTGITLLPEGHASFDFPTEFPGTAQVSGLVEFYSATGSFSILALQFESGAFTTAPVYPVAGAPILIIQ